MSYHIACMHVLPRLLHNTHFIYFSISLFLFILVQYGDNLRILIAAVPSKSPEEITEFYFRFIYSAVQIDKTTVQEVIEKEI